MAVKPFRILKRFSFLVSHAEHRLSLTPPDLPRPRGRARPPQTTTLGVPEREKGRCVQTQRAGGVEKSPLGDELLRPWMAGGQNNYNLAKIKQNTLVFVLTRCSMYCCAVLHDGLTLGMVGVLWVGWYAGAAREGVLSGGAAAYH